jgi:hypothetical protein
VTSYAEKCNVFSELLFNTFSINQITNTNNDCRVLNFLDLPDYSVQKPMVHVTPNEIKLIIKKLPNKKAPGHDRITNIIFKKLFAIGLILMTALFNSLLRLEHFPPKWKIATVILIKKPGKDESNQVSYRPISLLTSLSKIFEKFIHTRLQDFINSADTIPKFQFGFRSNHSTVQQLFRITEYISTSFEKHCHMGVVFIDISKSFDKVWHTDLMYKLKSINTLFYITSIKSFLSDRQFSIKINDSVSLTSSLLLPMSPKAPSWPQFYLTFMYLISHSHHAPILPFSQMIRLFTQNPVIQKR